MPWLHSLGKVIDMYRYPCKDCSERSVKVIDNQIVGCHSTCQKYLAARTEQIKKVQEIMKVKKAEDNMDDYKIRAIEKTKQRTAKGR